MCMFAIHASQQITKTISPNGIKFGKGIYDTILQRIRLKTNQFIMLYTNVIYMYIYRVATGEYSTEQELRDLIG